MTITARYFKQDAYHHSVNFLPIAPVAAMGTEKIRKQLFSRLSQYIDSSTPFNSNTQNMFMLTVRQRIEHIEPTL